MLLVVLVCAPASLAACERHTTPGSYYPLAQGMSWTLRWTETSPWPATYKVDVTNLAPQEVDGRKATPQESVTSGVGSGLAFYIEDSTGIYAFAEQGEGDAEPLIDPERAYELKYPIRVGTSWKDHPAEILEGLGRTLFACEVVIESIDDSVTVPAGTFRHCVQVRKRCAEMEMHTPFAFGKKNLTVEYRYWYAPGVGLVKQLFRARGGGDHLWDRLGVLESFKTPAK